MTEHAEEKTVCVVSLIARVDGIVGEKEKGQRGEIMKGSCYL